MKYRSFQDRRINTYVALILILIVSGTVTLSILRAIKDINFAVTPIGN